MSRFGDGGPARCSIGPKLSLERVFYSLKSPCLRGVERHILGLKCRICGWNGVDGSMGPGEHIHSLDLVMEAMPGAQ